MRTLFLSIGNTALILILAVGGVLWYRGYQRDIEGMRLLFHQQESTLASTQRTLDDTEQQLAALQSDTAAAGSDIRERIASVQALASKTASQKTDSDIVAEWKGRIGQVTCYTRDGVRVQGSATITALPGYGLVAVTNAHVTVDDQGNAPRTCFVSVTGLGVREIVSPKNDQHFFSLAPTYDIAYIRLASPASASDHGTFDTLQSALHVCQSVSIGEKIVLLGYPWDGSQDTVTATQGVISGFDGDYYVTDAKIDHGNSGGAAISVKNDCWLGIPSAVVVGSIESYGRILKGTFAIHR